MSSVIKFEIETRTVLNEPITLSCECEVFAESPEPGMPAKYYVDILHSIDHNSIDGIHDLHPSTEMRIIDRAIEIFKGE